MDRDELFLRPKSSKRYATEEMAVNQEVEAGSRAKLDAKTVEECHQEGKGWLVHSRGMVEPLSLMSTGR